MLRTVFRLNFKTDAILFETLFQTHLLLRLIICSCQNIDTYLLSAPVLFLAKWTNNCKYYIRLPVNVIIECVMADILDHVNASGLTNRNELKNSEYDNGVN